jgi:hypothetical protein
VFDAIYLGLKNLERAYQQFRRCDRIPPSGKNGLFTEMVENTRQLSRD